MTLAPSRYELLDRIAVGGMAEVYRAKAFGAHGFEKTLAIKRILPELAQDPEFEDRFIAEAKLAVELSHANVVQVLDFGRFAGTLFIAMELVSGLDLAALLKHFSDVGERVPIPAAFQISIDIVSGLSFAHNKGVVHRDVSPSNVLLSKAGEVKIADFGIAKAVQESEEEGRIMGKWRYMSPEQTQGRALDARSDLFSAASVIFEIFSGEKLFPGKDSKEIIENIHCMPVPRLSELRPGVPEVLDDLLAQALERDLDKRRIDGSELLRSLTEASYKSSIVATSMDVADAVGKALEAGVANSSAPRAGQGLDALIRAQLKGLEMPAGSERSTAVQDPGGSDPALSATQLKELEDSADARPGTIIRRQVDGDGVTVLELDKETVAARPASLRLSGQQPAVEGEDEVEREEPVESLDTADERAGRVVVGLDDDERAPAFPGSSYAEEDESDTETPKTDGGLPTAEPRQEPEPSSSRPLLWASLALLVAAGATAAVLGLGGGSAKKRSAAPAIVDAAPALPAHRQVLKITTVPPGAMVLVDGELLGERTPTSVDVAANKALVVELQLEGYESASEEVTLSEGESYHLRSTLKAFVSTLIVETVPAGAVVRLDGEVLGVTPFADATLRPGDKRLLTLEKKDYRTHSEEIGLVKGQITKVNKALKSTIVMGEVTISIRDSWADVYFNGKKVGRTTDGKMRLPVGKTRIKLKNPHSGLEKTVTIEVRADEMLRHVLEL